MWLLEHLHKLRAGIIESRLNFSNKEVTVRFLRKDISLREVVELLATIGYEPYISQAGTKNDSDKHYDKKKIYKLGVAGFCFGNIMLMSFPEYLSGSLGISELHANIFRILNLVLSLPVFFYSASEFFSSAWAGIKQKMLNIDAPIVLALIITFTRSIYEIVSGTGAGYLDSMSGIVFFMLVGRVVQERTYRSISFHRDYKAYFPIAVNLVTNGNVTPIALQDLKERDVIEVYNNEIIPADSIVVEGEANIDYSFVTGESDPVKIETGSKVYAGGKQTRSKLILQVIRPVAGSYLTSLWDHYSFKCNKSEINNKKSIIHTLSKYFTVVLFALAISTAIYWAIFDSTKLLPAVSAMLIVACPCALLLATTFTNGNLLRILSDNGLFLRDATVIEQLGKIDHIVFDKTGTLTEAARHIKMEGYQPTADELAMIYSAVAPSSHPVSKAIADYTKQPFEHSVSEWTETAGKGIEAYIKKHHIRVGSASFTGIVMAAHVEKPAAYIRIDDKVTAFYIATELREAVKEIVPQLSRDYRLAVLSGDNDRHKEMLQNIFNNESKLLFEQQPADKLHYIENQQAQGKRVLMIGDGLNDAGALQQSNVGITLADDINNFAPSCDAILDANKFQVLPALLKLAKAGSNIINICFAISILYNVVGLYFAMQAKMSPMIAAILMPASTLSIVLISTGISSIYARAKGLFLTTRQAKR